MTIVTYRPDLAESFASLNLEWIERFFVVEPVDLKVLHHPQETILDRGGEIFFAMDDEQPVGTVALMPTGPSEFELTKMAVTPSHQGRGLGWLLGEAAVDWARDRGVAKLFLLTNSQLAGAIRLYERLGFEHRQLPSDAGYSRADTYMEHPLTKGAR